MTHEDISHIPLGGPSRRRSLNSHRRLWKRPWNFNRDLFHQQFQGTIILIVFDFQGSPLMNQDQTKGWCFRSGFLCNSCWFPVDLPIWFPVEVVFFGSPSCRFWEFLGCPTRCSSSLAFRSFLWKFSVSKALNGGQLVQFTYIWNHYLRGVKWWLLKTMTSLMGSWDV